MLYIEKIKENQKAFADKVYDISKKLKINPNWLMLVMNSESRLNHKIVNPNGGATGLIQFMPKTAIGLDTTTQKLKEMSNVSQLDYVYKYFKPYAGRIKSYFDLYLITFFPLGIGKSDNWIMQTKKLSADTIAKQNPAINKFVKDNKITIGEFKKYVNSTIPKDIITKLDNNKLPITAIILLFGIGLFFLTK
jgi:hypothetical protein